jgi:hypothetical protein
MRKFVLSLAFIFIFISTAHAAPIPKEEITGKDKIWLARAMVAEAGWESKRDHVAIAYVLVRRWRKMQVRWPTLRFRNVMFAYVKGLGEGRREPTARQRWIRALSPDLNQPAYWPRNVRWSHHKGLWGAVIVRVEAWLSGKLRDPCRGRAWHWGGTIDEPWKKLEQVDCGETKNTFYRVINR